MYDEKRVISKLLDLLDDPYEWCREKCAATLQILCPTGHPLVTAKLMQLLQSQKLSNKLVNAYCSAVSSITVDIGMLIRFLKAANRNARPVIVSTILSLIKERKLKDPDWCLPLNQFNELITLKCLETHFILLEMMS